MGLHLYRRGGVYQFRLRLPQDLATKLKFAEFRFSLRTRDPGLAKRLGNAGRTAMAKLFDHLRMLMETGSRFLDNEEIRQLAQDFFEREVTFDAVLRMNASEDGQLFTTRREGRHDEEQELRSALGTGNAKAGERMAKALLERHDILKSDGTPVRIPDVHLNMLSFYLLRAKLAANLLAQAHDKGDFSAVPADPLFKDSFDPLALPAMHFMANPHGMLPASGIVPFSRLDERQQKTIEEVKKKLFKEKPNLKKKTRKDYTNTVTWLIQVIGDKRIGEVTEDDLLTYKETLLEAPADFNLLLKTDNIVKAVDLNGKRSPKLPLMAHRTVNNKYLGPIREIFAFAKRNGYTVQKMNPAADLRVKVQTKRIGNKKRLPFDVTHLQKMFNTPLYVGCKSSKRIFEKGTAQIRNHKYWVPLIALFSGCRLNEIGQMEVDDLKTFNGRPHFFVRTERDPEDELDVGEPGNQYEEEIEARDSDERSLKSDAARRCVPVHPELIRVGFLNYLNDRRTTIAAAAKAARGGSATIDRRLFPQWPKGADGYYSSIFSRWFNGQFLPKSKLKSERHVFHSLRHNFKDAVDNSGVPRETRNRILGHSSGHVSEDYGQEFLLPHQSNQIDKVTYRGLDLSHLHVAHPVQTITRSRSG